MKESGFLLLMEGWEKVGKTSLLKILEKNGVGTYEKRSNQHRLEKTSIEMLQEDLRPDGYYDSLLKRLDSGENILLDRMWPSAYAYGLLREEDEPTLRDLCFRLELRFHFRLVHVIVTKDIEFLELDDKFAPEQRETVLKHYTRYYDDIAWNPILHIDTTPWHQIQKPANKNIWAFQILSTLLKLVQMVNIR